MIGKRITLGNIFGIPFSVTYFWVLIFLFMTYTLSQPSLLTDYLTVITELTAISLIAPEFTSPLVTIAFAALVVLSIYTSVVLHELGHTYAALKHGITVNRITLWVLGGAAEINTQPTDPREEFEIAIAGPIVSFILFITLFTAGYATTFVNTPYLTAYLFIISLLNLFITVLNLAPAFPLDGGRILRSLLAAKYGYVNGTRKTTTTAKTLAVLASLTAIITFNLFGILLGVFVFIAASAEYKRVTQDHTTSPGETLLNNGTTQQNATGTLRNQSNAFTWQTFVFETLPDPYSMAETRSILQAHGATIDDFVTDSTDYIIVSPEHTDMYTTVAETHNATLIPASEFTTVLDQLNTTQH